MARPRACSSRWRAAGLLAWWPAWALLLGSGITPPAQAQSVAAVPAATQRAARCIDEDPPAVQPAADPAAAGLGLAAVVQAALAHGRSQSAARLLAEAVALDAEQTRAASQWQLALGARVGGEAARLGGTDTSQPAQASATLSLSRLLWDGGRQQSLLDWRLQLAQASRLAWLSQREQLALSAVMLALDAERHRVQEEVYGQYVRRMACLVDALADVVAVDRGRASELLQARKGVQQAELSLAAARSAHRQTEIRLRRVIGDAPVDGQLVGQALQTLPDLPPLLAAAEAAPELAQLEHQARAAAHWAQAVGAESRPQLSWSVAAARSAGWGGGGPPHVASLAAGIQLSVPLFSPGQAPAADAARARALAAREQLGDATDSRRARVRELHEQAQAARDRAQRLGAVLRDSQQLRSATQLQWQQLGRRSLFDVMGAESEHYSLRVAQANAIIDAQQLVATLQSLGAGLGSGPP